MQKTRERARQYESNAFERYLDNPCKMCGVMLNRENQARGWRGVCKPCRNERLKFQRVGVSHCLVCGVGEVSSDIRCSSCVAYYLNFVT